jgi:hypothetical protein
LTGVDQRAGFNKAVSWVGTDVEQLKKNAIVVFEDLADAEAARYLKLLAHDGNRSVSERAKRALEAIKKKEK